MVEQKWNQFTGDGQGARTRASEGLSSGAIAWPRVVATRATFRTKAGLRLTVESRKVLDDESILAALAEVMAQIEARRPAGDQAAA